LPSFYEVLPRAGTFRRRAGGHRWQPVPEGGKFKAVNNKGRNFTDRRLKRALRDIDKKIDAYLDELDENDAQEPEVRKLSAEELKEKIRTLRERMKKYRGLREQIEESGETQISLTDPDARSMPLAGGPRTQVGYNVQVAVDAKHKLIVGHEVTNAVTDRSLLPGLSGQDRRPDGQASQGGLGR